MKRTLTPVKTELGWEVFDGFAFEPDAQVFATKAQCQEEIDRANAEYSEWNRRGLADAPHMDAF